MGSLASRVIVLQNSPLIDSFNRTGPRGEVIEEDAKDKEEHDAERSGVIGDERKNPGSCEQGTDSNEIEQPKNIPSPEEIASWKRAIGEEARNRFRLSLLTVKEGAEGRPRPIKEEEVEGPKVEKEKNK